MPKSPPFNLLPRSPRGRPVPLLSILTFVAVAFGCARSGPAEDVVERRFEPMEPFRRHLWVTRWDYRSAGDVRRICENAEDAGFTDLLFQVRGEATVFFDSPYEPWAGELTGKNPASHVGKDPGWDPLAVAVREGHRRGLRVHAYVNVLPAWAQRANPRKGAGQIYTSHKSWLMVDSSGRRMTPRGFYAFVDPGIPEVQDHVAKVFGRLVKDYDVDGVHLDYIRYPFENGEYSYHPRVVNDFKEWYGKTPAQAPSKWIAYRQKQIRDTIKKIRAAVKGVRPEVELSAAVIAKPEVGKVRAGQDPEGWIRDGIVDAVAPMIYVENLDDFYRLAKRFLAGPMRSKVWLGVHAQSTNRVFDDQVRMAAERGAAGVAVFGYSEVFPRHKSSYNGKVFKSLVAALPESKTRPASRGPVQPPRGPKLKKSQRGLKIGAL